jgi:hypothetical protein
MLNTICICINIDREEDLLLILGIVKSTQESSRSETQSRESWRLFFLFFKAFAFYVFIQLCLIQFRLRGKDDEVFKTYYIRGCAEKGLQPLGNTVATVPMIPRNWA